MGAHFSTAGITPNGTVGKSSRRDSASGEDSIERRLVIHSELTEEYKQAKLSSIQECYKCMNETFGSGELTKFTLAEDEFDMVFSLAFNDPVEHFTTIWSSKRTDVVNIAVPQSADLDGCNDDVSESSSENGSEEGSEEEDVANVFQVFCALYLLCKEELYGLDGKIAAIHHLFDFDRSGALNRVELECLFQACASGLAKATGTQVPITDHFLSIMADSVMQDENEVTLTALKEWLSSRADVRNYLSEIVEARMVTDYQHRVDTLFERTTQTFCDLANGEPPEISVQNLEKVVRGLPGISPATNDEIKEFVSLLDACHGARQGAVGFDEFADAIMPWISFGVVDDDSTGTLSMDELKLLVWISGGENSPEPSRAVVRAAQQAMDANNDGDVTRLEWLRYNGCYDPQTGTMKFSKTARDMFKALDADGSKSVDTKELKIVFRKQLDDIVKNLESNEAACFSAVSLSELHGLLDAASEEVAAIFDENADGEIDWPEFSLHIDAIQQKQDKIKNYAKVLLDQDRKNRKHYKQPKCSTFQKRRHSIRILARLTARRSSLF